MTRAQSHGLVGLCMEMSPLSLVYMFIRVTDDTKRAHNPPGEDVAPSHDLRQATNEHPSSTHALKWRYWCHKKKSPSQSWNRNPALDHQSLASESSECALVVTGAYDRRLRLWDTTAAVAAPARAGGRAKMLGTLSSKVRCHPIRFVCTTLARQMLPVSRQGVTTAAALAGQEPFPLACTPVGTSRENISAAT